MGTSATTDSDDVFAPALYGGVDYQHASGLYAGAAATTVDIPGADALLRVDAGLVDTDIDNAVPYLYVQYQFQP